MQTKHVLILAGWLASVSAIVSGLHGWDQLLTPSVVSGLVGSLATQILSVYMHPPEEKPNV